MPSISHSTFGSNSCLVFTTYIESTYVCACKKKLSKIALFIQAKREINELKSTSAFKETKIKDLEEKTKEIEKVYETEGANWKTKFEETSKMKKEQTSRIVEMKNTLQNLEKDQNVLSQSNDRLSDQNTKLKEEMTTLITSFHSLKGMDIK